MTQMLEWIEKDSVVIIINKLTYRDDLQVAWKDSQSLDKVVKAWNVEQKQ